MTDILVAKDVSKTYFDTVEKDNVVALQGLSLAVRAHEFVSVIGPSGCGKSTFLRIVAGLDRPTSGEILVSGNKVTGPGADRGMVFQEYALLPWKTTEANIEFGLRLKGMAKEQRQQITQRFVDLVGLTGFEKKYPHQLSGGMRQRAARGPRAGQQPDGAADGRALRRRRRDDAPAPAGGADVDHRARAHHGAVHHPRHRGSRVPVRPRGRALRQARPHRRRPADRPAPPAQMGRCHARRAVRRLSRPAHAEHPFRGGGKVHA